MQLLISALTTVIAIAYCVRCTCKATWSAGIVNMYRTFSVVVVRYACNRDCLYSITNGLFWFNFSVPRRRNSWYSPRVPGYQVGFYSLQIVLREADRWPRRLNWHASSGRARAELRHPGHPAYWTICRPVSISWDSVIITLLLGLPER